MQSIGDGRVATSIDSDVLEQATLLALERIGDNTTVYSSGKFPSGTSGSDLHYHETDATSSWTPAFWTGQCWLADVLGDDDRYRETASAHLEPFRERLADGDVLTHDLGFLYTLAAWANYDRTGSETARQTALRAADLLADRFHPEPGVIQAWGDHRPGSETAGTDRYGQTIVDCMMNLPLLYRAGAHTGYEHYRQIAETHAATTAEYAVREDGSTAHGIAFDVESGTFEGQRTHQGAADDSCWSRGQAWAIYGFALSYRHTGREDFRDVARQAAECYLEEIQAARDTGRGAWVPPWDFRAEEGADVEDSSDAAIAACGFLELATHIPAGDPDRTRYERAGLTTLDALAAEYTTEGTEANGILAEGTANWNEGNHGQCTLWGDYFFLEALVRSLRDWTPFWARDSGGGRPNGTPAG
jgi:unsaturated chondroitin disaccharide hydrolase